MSNESSLPQGTAPAQGLVTGGELSDFTAEVAQPLHLGNRGTAAFLVGEFLRLPHNKVRNDDQANVLLGAFLQYLLDRQRYVDAAALLWPATLFSGQPEAVTRLFDGVFRNVAVMVPGAASMGKSYSLGVWSYLDWRRDPAYTNVQVVGPSEKHLERNLFSHLVKLHRQASIPGPGDVVELGITLDPHERNSGIFGVVVPIGKKASGRLQGVKVFPRTAPHPQFGKLSRLRVMLEEAENIPVGIWDDVTNILSNVRGVEQFKAYCPFNPKDPQSAVAQRCEPLDGWTSIAGESSFDWTSKRGWKVIRLDAYQSENVKTGQEVFFGLQTREGLERVIQNSGGVGTPGYYTMARGWWPPQGVDLAVIPTHLTHELFGELQFVESPEIVAAVDVALEGGDNAILALGRYGQASGWKKQVADPARPGQVKLEIQPFEDARKQPVVRPGIQVDQIFTLPKGDTTKLVAEIVRVARGAFVSGRNLGVDRTGNGAGVHDMLVATPGFREAVGINPSASPTERKILQEDLQLPCDEYAYLLSELWFGLRKWIEFGFLKISPQVPTDPLLAELTGRRFLLTQKKTKVESKKDYKSRGNRSPDRADALTMLVHVVRLRHASPSATGVYTSGGYAPAEMPQRIGVTDRPDRLD